MTVPYAPLTVANSFIELACESGGVEHMKLQKLVYYAYGWWLGHYGLEEERLTSEGPQIWKHGPVFASLYSALKTYGRSPILTQQSISPFLMAEEVKSDDVNAFDLIKWVWGRYGHLSSFALSDMTHKPGTSWYRTATENHFIVPYDYEINDKYIYEEFSKLLNNEQIVNGEMTLNGEREEVKA